jgi:hypothetical protein
MYFRAKNQVLVNTVYQLASLAVQIHAFSKEGYNTTQGTGANLQQRSSAADVSLTRLLNRLSSCSLSADLLCADWALARAELDCQPPILLKNTMVVGYFFCVCN